MAFNRVMRTGRPVHDVEHAIEHLDGRRVLLSINASPLRDAKGCITGVVASLTDITQQRHQQEQLRQSEERFRRFFTLAPEYCYMISPDGTILDANEAVLHGLGYAREELIVSPLLTTIYPPQSRDRAKALFEGWRQTGVLEAEEINIVTRSGQERTVLLSARAVCDAAGRLVHSTSVQTDITERKRAEGALLLRMHALERLNSLMVDRELRMIELKREINDLLAKAGEPEKYKIME